MIGKFHESKLSMEEPASGSEVLDTESNEPANRFRTVGKAWSFDRKWECADEVQSVRSKRHRSGYCGINADSDRGGRGVFTRSLSLVFVAFNSF